MGKSWSGQRDSNPRPPAPKAGALAKLRYAPIDNLTELKCSSSQSIRQEPSKITKIRALPIYTGRVLLAVY